MLRRLAYPSGLLLLALVTSCSQAEPQQLQQPVPETSSAAPAPSPPPPPPPVSPLTGRPVDGPHKAMFVKIDNTAPAWPPIGLEAADVVYVQQVEGGLTRLAAVYGTRIPARVGPVRSARITDLELMRQYGTPGFAYSGANKYFQPMIRKAPIVDLSPDRVPGPYSRASGRKAPYNLVANGKALLAARPKVGTVKDVGFRFGAAPAGGRDVRRATVRYPAARAVFTWDPDTQRWLWSMGDKRMTTPGGQPLGGSTVVVQQVRIDGSPFRDTNRNSTPYMRTVGKGKATILRDGKAWKATWERPTAAAGTTYRIDGVPVNFAPGQVWVALTGSAPTLS